MTLGLVYFKYASMFIRAIKRANKNGLQDLKNASKNSYRKECYSTTCSKSINCNCKICSSYVYNLLNGVEFLPV